MPIVNEQETIDSIYKGQYCLIEYPLPLNILAKNSKQTSENLTKNELRTMVKEP